MKKKRFFSRYTALVIVMLMIFSFMGYRLSDIQIVNADYYMDRSNNQAVRQISLAAPRGKIIDKNNVVLADDKQSYNLVYMETNEGKENFFDTFQEVFRILDSSVRKNSDGTESRDQLLDELELKVNPYRFEFNSSANDTETKKTLELLFKRNRGLNDVVRQRLYKNKTEAELTETEKAKVSEELLKITPEEVFDYLVVKYDLWKMLNLGEEESAELFAKRRKGEITDKDITKMVLDKFPPELVRKYLVVKDAIYLQNFSSYKPVTIAANIDKQSAFLFEQVKNNLPGIDISLLPIRTYPYGQLGSNFIGYISKISAASKEKYEERGYDVSTDYIGTAGLESAFEDRLRGSKGGTTVRINKEGRQTEELFSLEPYPGQNMILTIDSKLQSIAERALQDKMTELQTTNRLHREGSGIMDTGNATRGAAVVIDVNTGGVIAMASLPGYDPNLFSTPGRMTPELSAQFFSPDLENFGKQYIQRMGLDKYGTTIDKLFPVDSMDNSKAVRKDESNIYPKPFTNYATYPVPPGSTFKPLTSVAVLEEGIVTPESRIKDLVHFSLPGGTQTWACSSAYGHGLVDIRTALEKSCNYFFYQSGYDLYKKEGLDCLAKYAWKFGLGTDPNSNAKQSTGLEISEGFGNVYSNAYNKNQWAFYSKIYIAQKLNAGSYTAGTNATVRYTPLDISTNKKDSDELAAAKEALKSKVVQYIQGDYDMNNSFSIYMKMKNDLIPLFKNIINAMPEDQKGKYKKDDPQNMAEAISTYVTFDMITQITTPGNILNASIGQGMDNFTPVQLANYIATLVNGGNRYSVHLVDKFEDADGKVVEELKPQIVDKINLKKSTVDTIKQGMSLVTDEDGTAGKTFVNFPIPTGGKTGSATFKENGVQEAVGRTSYGVYVGFAPYDKPEIAVCVVIFDAGHGGYVADVARAIYEGYFRDQLKQDPKFVPNFSYTLNP
ncbi:MAG: penicillin-binding transpeptidase domain-containing protein [Bacillota bacterium]|nr:penicillin-binding transpeptidase domain-containing protein [Bacillota bacterium]